MGNLAWFDNQWPYTFLMLSYEERLNFWTMNTDILFSYLMRLTMMMLFCWKLLEEIEMVNRGSFPLWICYISVVWIRFVHRSQKGQQSEFSMEILSFDMTILCESGVIALEVTRQFCQQQTYFVMRNDEDGLVQYYVT